MGTPCESPPRGYLALANNLSYKKIVRDAADVDFSVDNVHSTLTLAFPSQTDGTNEP